MSTREPNCQCQQPRERKYCSMQVVEPAIAAADIYAPTAQELLRALTWAACVTPIDVALRLCRLEHEARRRP